MSKLISPPKPKPIAPIIMQQPAPTPAPAIKYQEPAPIEKEAEAPVLADVDNAVTEDELKKAKRQRGRANTILSGAATDDSTRIVKTTLGG